MKNRNVKYITEEKDFGYMLSMCAGVVRADGSPVLRNAAMLTVDDMVEPPVYGERERAYVTTVGELPLIEDPYEEDGDGEPVMKYPSISADERGFYYEKPAPILKAAVYKRRPRHETIAILMKKLDEWLTSVHEAGLLIEQGKKLTLP